MNENQFQQEALRQAHVEIAVLKNVVENQARQFEQLQKLVMDLNTKIDGIKDTLAEARGGWRTLLWIGGAAATAGGLVSWALSHLRFNP